MGKKRHLWWLQISSDCNFRPRFFASSFDQSVNIMIHYQLSTFNRSKPQQLSVIIIIIIIIIKSLFDMIVLSWIQHSGAHRCPAAAKPSNKRRQISEWGTSPMAQGPPCTFGKYPFSYSQLIPRDVGAWTEWLNSLGNDEPQAPPPPSPPFANLPNPANSLKWALLSRTGARVGVQMGFMSTLPWGSDAPPCNTCRVFFARWSTQHDVCHLRTWVGPLHVHYWLGEVS